MTRPHRELTLARGHRELVPLPGVKRLEDARTEANVRELPSVGITGDGNWQVRAPPCIVVTADVCAPAPCGPC